MKTWECKVLVEHTKGYAPIPRTMRTQANNYIEAKAYFQTFGKLMQDPRIVNA